MKQIFAILFFLTLATCCSAQWETSDDIRVVNFDNFTIGFSDSLRMPLWAFYKMTDEMATAPKKVSRSSLYQSEGSRSSNDFTGSGYDRGHLVPFAAMDFSAESAKETFSMYNIVPQTPFVNRGIWSSLENQVTKLAEKLGCIYVNIDADFQGDYVITTKDVNLPVPRYMTMYVYDCDGVLVQKYKVKNIH